MSDDIHALSGAYAVDALDEVERAEFELHLAACSACQHEVTSLQEAAALMATATMLVPSVDLRERVLAGITMVRPLPPLVSSGTHRADVRFDDRVEAPPYRATVTQLAPRRRRAATFLAAAAAVVAVGSGGVVWHEVSGNRAETTSVAAQIIAAPDSRPYTEKLGGGVTATVYRSQKLNKAVLVTRGFPLAQSGKEYALWFLRDGKDPVAAGILPAAADNEVVLSGDAASATAAGITVEDAGTTPSTPSGPMVANINFQET